jgi:hypothetical protein
VTLLQPRITLKHFRILCRVPEVEPGNRKKLRRRTVLLYLRLIATVLKDTINERKREERKKKGSVKERNN